MAETIKEDDGLDQKLIDIGRETPFREQTEIGQVFENLDDDTVNKLTGMSKIDFNARLSHIDISNCIVIDELQQLGILPATAKITTQKKRLSVSKDGLGRREKTEIASASRGADLSGRSGGFFSRLLTPRP